MLLALLASAPPSPGTQALLFGIAFIVCVVGAILSVVGWHSTPGGQPGAWWGGSWLWFLLFVALAAISLVWFLDALAGT